jgi:hypothetical protein
MSTLNVVRQLIAKMSPEEIKIARKFLNAFNTRGEKEHNKGVVLLTLLVDETKSNRNYQEHELEKILYGRTGGVAFPRMLLRFKEKLFESLLLSPNLDREGSYSERARVMYEIRREVSQAQIVLARGMQDQALEMFNSVIQKAQRYELFEECLLAVRNRIEINAFYGGIKSHRQDKELYDKTLRALDGVKKAIEYYTHLLAETEFEATPGEPYFSERLDRQINELYDVLKDTSSAYVAFYLNYIEAHHLQLQHRYKAAAKVLQEQVNIIVQYPAIKSNSRLAGALINNAWNELYCQNFTKALQETEKAIALLPPGNSNLFQCYETQFYCYFYTGRYNNAVDCLTLQQEQEEGLASEFSNGKRSYMNACIAFVTGRHDKAHEILRDLNPIEDDDAGWNIGIRFLHIMNDIELEKTENAVSRIENLRKHLEKLKKNSAVASRDRLKYEILRELVNTRFNFTETHTRRKSELDALSDSNTKTRWRLLTPELIPFEQWFDSRLYKTPLKIKLKTYSEPIVISK